MVLGYFLAVLIGLLVCQLAILLTTVFLHRAVSHRAVTMSPALRFACRSLLWVTTGIRPRQWAAVHRKHHAFTDVEGDPHSPALEGFWRVQLGNVLMYRHVAKDDANTDRYARDLPPDRWDRVLFDHALLGLGVGVGILFLVFWGDWRLVLVASAVHTVTYLALNSAVNAVGHSFGRRLYPGLPANSQWLAWLTAGEGLHSNHHAAPTSARLSLHRREMDPGWWFIAAARRFRWLTVRHEQPRLTAKAQPRPQPELV
ncbi:MAG: fatty acid desaturase [Acidimicrobiales bacterium]